MAISGLTQTQSDFVEKYIKIPKVGGRKKAKARREEATRDFRRFNVNREAVAARIAELGDPAVKSLLRGELARAETLIGDDASDLHFDDAMAQLSAVNKAVADHLRQAEVRQKHGLMLARMDIVEQGPGLDNIDDINRVWTFADSSVDSALRSNNPGLIAEVDKALDQLRGLIDAGRPDITGAGRESKAKLRAVAERLAAAQDIANVVFDAQHVPPALTALFRTVRDRLDAGEAADVPGLPAAANAAEGAMDAAETGAETFYAARRKWHADHARFRLRFDLMEAHVLSSEPVNVAPKFQAIRDDYKAAGDLALAHDYARACTDLAPLFGRIDTALTFADDYQNFQALYERRKAMVDGLTAVDDVAYDQVKDAITAAHDLLTEAEAERDAGRMGTALQKLVQIAAAVAKAKKLDKVEDEFIGSLDAVEEIKQKIAAESAEFQALLARETKYLEDESAAAIQLANGNDLDSAAQKASGLASFAWTLTKRSPKEIADKKLPRRNEEAEAYLAEKPAFLARLQEVRAITDADGKIAITAYLAEMNEAKTRLDKWEADGTFFAALELAKQLAAVHAGRMDDAARAKTYLEKKADVDAKVTQLESGVAGGDTVTEMVAMTKRMVADALAMSQKDDWFQAARMMGSAQQIVDVAKLVQNNVEIVGNMVDAAVLANVGADFDAAYGQFDQVLQVVKGLDEQGDFSDRLDAAENSAKQARNALPGDAAGAQAQLEAAIAECREVMVLANHASAYRIQVDAIKPALEDIRKKDRDNLLKPEIDAIEGHLDAGEQAADGLDFKTALDEMSKAQNQVKTSYGTTPYIDDYVDALEEFEEIGDELDAPDVKPGLTDEIARFEGLVDDVKTAFRDRKIAEMRTLIAKTKELGAAYQELAEAYTLAVETRDEAKALFVSRLSHPVAAEHMAEARAQMAEVDRAMDQHLYNMAFRMADRVFIPIGKAEDAIDAFEALRPVKIAATDALRDIEERDDPESGAAHDRILALRAVFDAALDKENMRNYTGATRLLTDFPARCEEVVPLLDAFDLYVAARDEAEKEIGILRGKGTEPIAPMFDRIEKKRDNALRLAGNRDFDTARDLFVELLDDCLTADATLSRQSAFEEVMGQIKDVDDGDTDDLKAAIAAAAATLVNLRARPAALFLTPELEAVDDSLDKARADAEDDFDGALALVTAAVDDCGKLAGEMGRFDQFTDSVELARKLATALVETHPQGDFARDEVQALLSRVDSRMAAVRADPARRSGARDDIEAVISTCRDLRHMLDSHQAWHLEMRKGEDDLRLLEGDENRHLIGADLRACRQKLDDSAAKATARDHRGAMKDLASATDLRAKARLRIKACLNEAPEKAELEALLATENGDAMLDDIINGLDEEAQRKVMNVAFEARFGCKLKVFESPAALKLGTEDADLGKKAPNIQRFFKLMSALPPASTRDNDSMLIFSHVGDRQTGSSYSGSRKEVAMREGEAATSGIYATGLEHELGVDPATLELQQGEAIDFFSWNTLHEVGHAVDDKLGFMKTRGESLAGWKVFGANVRPVAEAIAGDLNFDSDYLMEYISDGANSAPPIPEPVGCTSEEWERRRREACAWVDRVRVGNDPWASDSTAKNAKTAAGKVYHESYANNWCCYDYSARAKGVSGYQFRAPGEWFSELYAAVHTKRLKASHPHYDVIANAK